MNQVPEKDILVRNQIQMYNKKISGQYNVTIETPQTAEAVENFPTNMTCRPVFHETTPQRLLH
jgi:hypothetical protein